MNKLFAFIVFVSLFASCAKEKDESPQIPPAETMEMDYSAFTAEKSALMNEVISTRFNYTFSALNVGFWNLMIGTTLAVPVASFKTAIKTIPVKIGDKSWQWSFNVNGFASAYTARLTGTIVTDSVEWKMYITKSGIGGFDEFLWFSGTSATDRSGGYWVLNHSNQFPEKLLKIDWKRENSKVGDIKYTIVRDLNDNRQAEVNKGAYIHYGLQDNYFDAYYTIHVWGPNVQQFIDINIEWSRTQHDGHVKSPRDYDDELWHCWNSDGYDTLCE